MADKKTNTDGLHGLLDAGGFVPGPVGVLSDAVNAVIYLAEGDMGNAALSALAVIPVIGDGIKAAGKTVKTADKIVKAADNAADVEKGLDKTNLLKAGERKNTAAVAKKDKMIVGAKGKLTSISSKNLTKARQQKKNKGVGLANTCFTGDTLVLTKQGLRPIKEIREGDDICSRNAQTGETGFRKTEGIFRLEAHTVHHIWLDGSEELKTTAYHPFYVKGKGWVSAINLQEGYQVETLDGTAQVTKTVKVRQEEPVEVYNFHVEEWESYFVSEKKAYVHNVNCHGKRSYSKSFGRYTFKEGIDTDLRGQGTYKDALEMAFDKTGVPKKEFSVTKWGKDKHGKSFPVEWRADNGAEVNIDLGHSPTGDAPTVPHVGWQTGGKRGSGGAVRGHIFVDDVPYNR